MEYYIPTQTVSEKALTFQFAVLESYKLVYQVMVPASANTYADESENVPENEAAYLLTEEFIRLLFECIMLRTISGNNWEYSLEDDLLDYEKEDDDED